MKTRSVLLAKPMSKYTAPDRPQGYTRDKQGRVLSFRRTDGTGWDYKRDKQGRELIYRETDGTGWDYTYGSQGRVLSFRRTDGTGWDYTYDSQGRELSYRRTGGTSYDYIYDKKGRMLVFAGTRSIDLMMMAIRLAGFELRDAIGYAHDGGGAPLSAWIYGSGFPKSLHVSRAIDKTAGAGREVSGIAEKSGSVRNRMAGDFARGEYMTTAAATQVAPEETVL